MKPDIAIRITLLTLAAMVPVSALADWKIQFDSVAAESLHMKYNDTLRGSFATRAEAEAYQRSRPLFEQHHSSIVGFDTVSPSAAKPRDLPGFVVDDKPQTRQLESSLNRSQADEQLTKRHNAQIKAQVDTGANGFQKNKDELFTVHSSVRLRYEDQTTNRSSYSTPKVRKLGPLAHLSDQELERRYQADEAEFQSLVQDAKRRGNNSAKQQVVRNQAEGDIREAATNWRNARIEAGVDAVFTGAGEGAAALGLKKTADAIDVADKGRTIYSGAREIAGTPSGATGQNNTEPSGPYDVAKSQGAYNSPWTPAPEPLNLESSQNFKSGANLNEFSNLDFTKVNSEKKQPTKQQEAEWNRIASSADTSHPRLVAGRPASENNSDSGNAGLVVAQTALGFAGPEAGVAMTSGKYAIESGAALENHSIYGNLVHQANDFDEGSAKYATFYTQRMRELKQDEEAIRAEQAQRVADREAATRQAK
jgi:hypothetical protein